MDNINQTKFQCVLVGALFAFALTGCSGGGSSSGLAQTTVTSSTPANGAIKVNINSDIRVSFSAALDAATVNSTSVILIELSGRGERLQGQVSYKGQVSYDAAAQTLTFTPLKPLFHYGNYQLNLSGLQDVAGNILAAVSISFQTWLNPNVQQVNYIAGMIASYSTNRYDTNGNQTQYVNYNGVGVDGIWFTADDVANFFNTNSYDANGNQTQYISYTGAGADGILFTADDVLNAHSATSYDANGNRTQAVNYNGAGVDGIWFTSDDVKSSTSLYDTSL